MFISFLSAGISFLVAANVAAAASPQTDAEAHRSACIRGMKLSTEEVESGLHEYRIEKCIEGRLDQELNATRLERAAARQERQVRQFRGRLREGKRFLSPVNQERFNPDQEGGDERARAISRRKLRAYVEQTTYKEARSERSQLRQERMRQAREACAGAERSFYPNCVRDMLRLLGESADDESAVPSTRRY